MSYQSDTLAGGARDLTFARSVKPAVECRRIDRLKQFALEIGLTADDAKKFGWLSKTATWEALLESRGIDFDRLMSGDEQPVKSDREEVLPSGAIGFLRWVDPLQLLACLFVAVGTFILVCQVTPGFFSGFLPVRITVEIGNRN
jgi:hypothetical protein